MKHIFTMATSVIGRLFRKSSFLERNREKIRGRELMVGAGGGWCGKVPSFLEWGKKKATRLVGRKTGGGRVWKELEMGTGGVS